jgi:alternate signal-mediated exported protein
MAGVCTPDEFCEADMDQSIKGALAAATAGVVLVGSLGSFAYWKATGTFDGDTIESGKLALIDTGGMYWLLNNDSTDIGTVTLVPGDRLEFGGGFTLDAEGNNLSATLDVTGGAFSGTLEQYLDTSVTFQHDGVPITDSTVITEDDDGGTIEAYGSMEIPFGTGVENESQGLEVNLSDVVITLTQTDESQ